ncbi:MAG: hypothetical protein ACYS9X_14135 [Planctomycetota bacterium]|jgi:hypothetical protein
MKNAVLVFLLLACGCEKPGPQSFSLVGLSLDVLKASSSRTLVVGEVKGVRLSRTLNAYAVHEVVEDREYVSICYADIPPEVTVTCTLRAADGSAWPRPAMTTRVTVRGSTEGRDRFPLQDHSLLPCKAVFSVVVN